MEIQRIQTKIGTISYCDLKYFVVSDPSVFQELLLHCPDTTMALDVANVGDSFFTLASGVAQEWLRIVTKHHRRLIIFGTGNDINSGFKSFMTTCNRNSKMVFAPSIPDAVVLLT